MSLKNKKIALIGGAGFIGHHLALDLAAAGANVEIVDGLQVNHILSFASKDKKSPNRHLYDYFLHERIRLLREAGIPLHVQDARDYHMLTYVLSGIRPDVIIHLAAVAHADQSNKDPFSTFDHSLRTLENALDLSRYGTVGHFIFFSSSMVYGHFPQDIVTEETPCDPLGIYGALKFAAEKIVIAYNQVFGLPYTIIRPSALYGERCVSRRVSQIFIENGLSGQEIAVYGNGSDRLDFTYIRDLTQGVIRIVENEKAKGQILNLTYGESRSISDLIKILSDHVPDVKVDYRPKDRLTPNRGTLSVKKAEELIGYRPSYPLEKGYTAYINWYKSIWDIARRGTYSPGSQYGGLS